MTMSARVRTFTRLSRLATGGLLLGGGLWLFTKLSFRTEVTDDPVSASLAGDHTMQPRAAFVGDVLAADLQTAAQPQPLPAPAHLRSVFPDLDHDVQDWRGFAPDLLTVQLAPGVIASFRVVDVQRDTSRTVMTARLDRQSTGDVSIDGVFLVGTANTRDRWTGLVAFPGMEYRIEVAPGHAAVTEVPAQAFPCGTDDYPSFSDEGAPGLTAASNFDDYTGPPAVVDVLFLYNQAAFTQRNFSVEAIDADCSNYIAASNAVLVNSRVRTFVWRYLGVEAAPAYSTSSMLENELILMSSPGVLGDFVSGISKARKADQVVLLSGGIKVGSVGNAWVGGLNMHSVVNYPRPTTPNGTQSSVILPYYVVCHELAHNLGCRHERDDPNRQYEDGDGEYSYAHVFTDTSQGAPSVFGTIMAITGTRIFFFSHPEVQFRGQPIGVPIDNPRAAFNARQLNEMGDVVAVLADAESDPVITRQPVGVSVVAGQSVVLSVEATGGGLIYRWFKGEEAIEGAIQSSYTIPQATVDDSGPYVVAVANVLNYAVSQVAQVTVTSPPPPPPPPPSGGGGGGGSLDGIVAFLLLLLVLGRRSAHAPASKSAVR